MAAIAFAPTLKLMPNFPPRADDFGELGFTQQDRDELKQGTWLLKDIREKLDAFDRRLAKVEDGRAHQKDLEELRVRYEIGHKEVTAKVDNMALKLATIGGGISLLIAIEPILIHFFWH